MSRAFELRHVVHLVRPLGRPAGDLESLRAGLAEAPPESLFHHAVQYALRDPAAGELPPDDFSAWIGGVVQDAETAERFTFAVQGAAAAPEPLRRAALEVLDALPAKRRAERAAPPGSEFRFRTAASLVVPTGVAVRDGRELLESLIEADAGVWFLHLVEEPWSGGGPAPLLAWLEARGDARLARWLAEASSSGLPIDKARARVLGRWRRSHLGRRVAEAAASASDERIAAGREAIASLARRAAHPEDQP